MRAYRIGHLASHLNLLFLMALCACTNGGNSGKDGGPMGPDAAVGDLSSGGRDGGDGGGGDAATPGDGGGAGLTWFTTCGDVVCRGHRPMDGVALCAGQKEGAACSTAGLSCDLNNMCNVLLVCADQDPKDRGCPRSRQGYKRDIHYLTPQELTAYYEELRRIRLATYRYRNAGPEARQHLGFIIEDQEPSMSIDAERDMVDLYGYASMAVAAVQVQAGEIELLKREIRRLRADLAQARRHGN